MEALNVLVADLTHTSAFFLRSVLRASGHRVSIAFSVREAIEKVSTGLFDVVLADAHPFAAVTGDLLEGLREALPTIPALLVTDVPEAVTRSIPHVFGVVPKPVRLPSLWSALRQAAAHLDRLRDKREHLRRTVDLPVELRVGHRRVQARAVNLSLGGVQVDTGDDGHAWRIVSLAGSSLQARLFLGSDGATLDLPARLAYVDGTDGAPDHVGLAFSDLAAPTRTRLASFLAAA